MKNLILILYLFPVISLAQDAIFYKCIGDAVILDGVSYTDEGLYSQTFLDQNGIDSTVVIQIINHDEYYFFFTQELCTGESYEGNSYFSDTTITDSLTTINGCDSIIERLIDVRTFFVSGIAGNDHICAGDTTILSVGNYPNYQWSTGEDDPIISVTTPDTYSVTITDNIGCEEILTKTITQTNIKIAMSLMDIDCRGASNGEIHLDNITGGVPEYSLTLSDGSSFFPHNDNSSFLDLDANEYMLTIKDEVDCQDSFAIEITEPVQDFQVELIPLQDEYFIGDEAHFLLSATLGIQDVLWDCQSCSYSSVDNILTIQDAYNGVISAEVSDTFGCIRFIDFELNPKIRIGIIAPNIFSPNNDGINDAFVIKTDKDIQRVQTFQVFDRYGNLIHIQKDIIPKDVLWDGKYNGSIVVDGVYTYIIDLILHDNKSKKIISSITKI